MRKMNYKQYKAVVVRSKYMNNDNLALKLIDEKDGSLITTITVNTEDKLPEGFGYVKNYSKNEVIMEVLQEEGLIKEVFGYKQMGWVTVPLVEFDLEGVDEL